MMEFFDFNNDEIENKLDNLLCDIMDLVQQSDFSEFINTIQNYSEQEFKHNFRLNRSTVLELIHNYKSYNLSKKGTFDALFDIYVYIWYLSNTLKLGELANLFGVEKSAALKALIRVSKFIIDRYNKLVNWPNPDESKQNSIIFEQLTKIPNVIGILDLVHVRINAPKYDKGNFLNGQRYYSVSVQVIVDANKKFIDVYSYEPGSLQPDHVLKNSPIYEKFLQNMNLYFPQNTFVLGKSIEYPETNWLVPPFRENVHLCASAKRFNHLHYGAGKIAQDAIGQMMIRFQKLYNFEESLDLDVVTQIIYSAFILHNLCIIKNDSSSEFVPNPIYSNSSKRQLLVEELLFKNII